MHVGDVTQITLDYGQTYDKLIKERIDSPAQDAWSALSTFLSETVLKISIWSEDVRITLGLSLPF